jgi:predicted GNAT family acetyltransferase
MDIKHIEGHNRGAFIIKSEHKRLAELTYSKSDDNSINIDHTEVDESLRGQGVGQKLVKESVEFAREKGLKITATCPYASKLLSRNSEYSDVYQA